LGVSRRIGSSTEGTQVERVRIDTGQAVCRQADYTNKGKRRDRRAFDIDAAALGQVRSTRGGCIAFGQQCSISGPLILFLWINRGTRTMQLPLQITFRNVDHSPALEAAVRERMDKLEHACPTIMSCRVVLESVAAHKHHGKTYSVHIDVKVPRHEVAITRDQEEDIYVALREAFEAAKRRLVEK
jgi:ribosomal subunit interface protein